MRKTKLLVVLGLLLFAWVIWSAGPEKLASQMAGADPVWMGLVLVILAVSVFVKGLKWQMISAKHGYQSGIIDCTKIWLVGLAGASVTPGRLGDFMKAVYLKQAGKIPLGRGISAVMIERITDVAVLFSLAAFGLIFTGALFMGGPISPPIIGAIIVMGFAGLWALTQKKVVGFIARPIFKHIIPERFRNQFSGGFDELYGSMFEILKQRKFLLLVILLSYVTWVLSFSSLWAITKAIGIDLPIIYIVAFAPLATLMELLPITVGGFGTREATAVFLYGLAGLAPSTTVAMMLISVITSWIAVGAGFLVWLKRPAELKGMLSGGS